MLLYFPRKVYCGATLVLNAQVNADWARYTAACPAVAGTVESLRIAPLAN